MNNDLISRKALLERIEKDAPWWWQNFHSYLIVDMLKEAPVIDAEPVRHGKWEDNAYIWKCGSCHKWLLVEDGDADMNYCPNCGARMDGGTYDDYRHDDQ